MVRKCFSSLPLCWEINARVVLCAPRGSILFPFLSSVATIDFNCYTDDTWLYVTAKPNTDAAFILDNTGWLDGKKKFHFWITRFNWIRSARRTTTRLSFQRYFNLDSAVSLFVQVSYSVKMRSFFSFADPEVIDAFTYSKRDHWSTLSDSDLNWQ